MLRVLFVHVIFYQVKLFMFYNVQTIGLTLAGK